MVKNQKCPKSPVTSAADYIFCILKQDKILYIIFNEVTFTKSEVNFCTLKRVILTVQADLRSLVHMDCLIFDEIGDLVIAELKLFYARIKYEDSDKLDWVYLRHTHQILPLKMNLDFSSTGGGDPKVELVAKNLSAVHLGSKVDAKTEICHITILMVKSPKQTQSAVINHEMVILNMRPKWSRNPIERFSDSSIICCIVYAQTAVIRILVVQLICWWSHIKCSRSHHPWLIIMLLLLNAAKKPFCTHVPYRSTLSVLSPSGRCSILFTVDV